MVNSKKNDDADKEPRASEMNAITDNAPPTDVEALKINEILYAKYYDAAGLTWWWNSPNSELDGQTPHQVWLAGSNTDAIDTIEMAANAAPQMGHAT
jgi:hypothetical protein